MPHQTVSEPSRPDRELVARLREAAAALHPDRPELASWYSRYVNDNALRRLAFDLGRVRSLVSPQARILEVGAVPPLLTLSLARLGYRVEGVDLDPERFAGSIAALGLAVRRVDVECEPLPFAAGSFDAVLFLEVFEHLRIDPIFTLGEVLRVLRPGGLLLLSTPNLTSLQGLWCLVVRNRTPVDVYEQFRKIGLHGHAGHVRTYTSKEVAEFLEKVGFRVETVIRRGWLVRQPPWKQRLLDLTVGRLFPRLRSHTGVVARKP